MTANRRPRPEQPATAGPDGEGVNPESGRPPAGSTTRNGASSAGSRDARGGFAPLAADIEARFGVLAPIDTSPEFQAALARAGALLSPWFAREANVGFVVAVIIAAARDDHRLCPHRLALMLGAEMAKALRGLCAAGGQHDAGALLDTMIETQAPRDRAQLRFLLQLGSPITAEGRA